MLTDEALRHVEKAKEYIAKGDQFYRRAKPEIEAAIAAGATQREVARTLARSHSWVQDVLAWDGEGTLYSKDTKDRMMRRAAQFLKEAPREEVEQVVISLPAERQGEIVVGALEQEQTREAVVKTKKGVAAIKRASRAAHIGQTPTEDEPLPPAPRVAQAFWSAVQAVAIAYEQVERYGMADLALDRDAREAGERLYRQAGEISAAITEATNDLRLEEV